MRNIFGPAVALMARLKFPQRFALITTLFLLPLVITLSMFMSRSNSDVEFGQKEIHGTAYLRPASLLFRHTLDDWLLSQNATRGLDTNKDELAQNQGRINADFAALDSVESRYGGALGTGDRLTALKSEWAALKEMPYDVGRQLKYESFIAQVRELIAYVGDNSNLILDPALDTYYTSNSIVVNLPEVQNTLATLAVQGDGVVGRRQIDESEKANMAVLSGKVVELYREMKRNVDVALANNSAGNLQPAVEGPLTDAVASTDVFVETFTNQVLTAPLISMTLDQWMSTARQALNATYKQWDAQADQMELMLQNRVNNATKDVNTALLVTAIVLLVVLYMWIGFYLAVMRSVHKLEEASLMMASGNMGDINLEANDELSQRAAVALSQMATTTTRLNSAVTARTNELTQVAQLLRYMPDGVVLTDARGTVNVLNGAASRMLGVSFDQAVGHSLSEVAQAPRLQETIQTALQSPGQPYLVDVAMGGGVFAATVTFVPGSDGALACMVVMQDVTELRALQQLQRVMGLSPLGSAVGSLK
jgi:PAS domain S-box-containing protein